MYRSQTASQYHPALFEHPSSASSKALSRGVHGEEHWSGGRAQSDLSTPTPTSPNMVGVGRGASPMSQFYARLVGSQRCTRGFVPPLTPVPFAFAAREISVCSAARGCLVPVAELQP